MEQFLTASEAKEMSNKGFNEAIRLHRQKVLDSIIVATSGGIYEIVVDYDTHTSLGLVAELEDLGYVCTLYNTSTKPFFNINWSK